MNDRAGLPVEGRGAATFATRAPESARAAYHATPRSAGEQSRTGIERFDTYEDSDRLDRVSPGYPPGREAGGTA